MNSFSTNIFHMQTLYNIFTCIYEITNEFLKAYTINALLHMFIHLQLHSIGLICVDTCHVIEIINSLNL